MEKVFALTLYIESGLDLDVCTHKTHHSSSTTAT